MNRFQDAYEACLRQAGAQADGLMKGLVGSALQQLFRREAASPLEAERKLLESAVRLLNRHEAFLRRRFQELVVADFQAGAASSSSKTESGAAISFDRLELMDDDQVQERVEIARVQQDIVSAAEAELDELNRLICGAQGLNSVIAERNPMRPEVYARALQAVLAQTAEPPRIRLVWIQALGGALGEELAKHYRFLCQYLRDAGVMPAGYLVVKTLSTGAEAGAAAASGGFPGVSGGGGSAEAAAAGGGTALSGWAGGAAVAQRGGAGAAGGPVGVGTSGGTEPGSQSKLLTLEHLRRLLAGEAAPQDSAGEAGVPLLGELSAWGQEQPDFSRTVPAAFEALHEMKQVDAVIRRITGRQKTGAWTPNPVPATGGDAVRAAAPGRPDPRHWGQALALEVVGLMVDNMAGDARLAEPVRQAVRSLHPALMSLALKDPRFFSDRQHPARRLLAEITERGLAYAAADAEGFDGFFEPVRCVVDRLATADIEGSEPFVQALEDLHGQWADHVARERERREKAIQALVQAERRTLLANQISHQLRGRTDLPNTAPEVVALLVGPWSQVMAQARLSGASEEADPGGYGAVVSDLIWSAQPELARRDRAALVRKIPRLIETLRAGLQSIDYPSEMSQAFFEVLMSLHQQALARSDGPRIELPRLPMSRSDLEACFERADGSALWVVKEEAKDSGFFEPLPSLPAIDPPAPQNPPPGEATGGDWPLLSEEGGAGELDAMTQMGAWIERLLDGVWLRAQLTWANPQGTLFVYTGANGRVQSMTLRTLKRLQQEGAVRLLAAQTLVDGALDAVAQRALRNSVEDSR